MQFARKLSALAGALTLAFSTLGWATGYEVWVSDQTNSKGVDATNPNGTHGSFIRIYDSSDLERTPIVDSPDMLDAGDLFPSALANTGAHVVRLHGMLPSPNHNYMNVNFVTSGHLAIIDARTRTPVALWKTTATSTGRQNHMSFWSPDGRYLLIANQAGKLLERVNVTWDGDGDITEAVYDAKASLDIVGGTGRISAQPVADTSFPMAKVAGAVPDGQTTLTPRGQPKESPSIRPNNQVVCPIASSNNRHVLVTLAGGGMFVVDYTVTPMRIVAEYDNKVVRAAGCGGIEAGSFVQMNAGTPGPNKSEFTVYRFPVHYPPAPASLPVNTPKPKVIYFDPDNGKTAGVELPLNANRDAHGMGRTATGTYIHQFDRVRNNAESFNMATLQRHTYSLTTTDGKPNGPAGTACGTTTGVVGSNDPTPDLLDLSPHGNRFYIALRGPFPLTFAHAATGSCPGLGVIELTDGGKSGRLIDVLETSHLNADGTKNISDPHGAIVRLK